jgi:V/A-type H+-transporting ATPase subunit A
MAEGRVVRIAGPVVVGEGLEGAFVNEVVRVGQRGLVGEIIGIEGDRATVQVYEETGGMRVGDPIEAMGYLLSVELGPGIIGSIFDGIQRPLDVIRAESGDFVPLGIDVPSIDRKKKWEFKPQAKKGDEVVGGSIIGTVDETPIVEHRIMVPHGIEGRIKEIREGKFTVEETIAIVETKEGDREITMLQRWPVRRQRPYAEKLSPEEPLITGQRVLDTFFPVAKGGTACVPGPFGSGKTVIQHQLSKWADADIIIFVGCGERGNEMAEVLLEFPELVDPRTNRPLMERTILVANTSNMPFAARESSIYTGITIAEYFRDMGYTVALQADSTSRWAEALREISGRLEEMPGEEGYPAYLASRLAEFYERSGKVRNTNGTTGALTVIGAVSPPGGDFSEPVTQSTLRVTKVFWALDAQLAYARHFPAVNWLNSYSLYLDQMKGFYSKVDEHFIDNRNRAMAIMQQEGELREIVRLVGIEGLSEKDRLLLDVAGFIKDDFLYQSAFHEVDTYTPIEKQALMLDTILFFYDRAREALEKGKALSQIEDSKVLGSMAEMRFKDVRDIDKIRKDIAKEMS